MDRLRINLMLAPLAFAVSAALPAAASANDIVVRFKPGVTGSQRASVRQAAGTSARRALLVPRAQLVEATGGSTALAIEQLERSPLVAYAEADSFQQIDASPPNDPSFGQQWGLRNAGQTVNSQAGISGIDINALSAWDTTRGAGQLIAIVDSGVAIEHPDLATNIWSNPGEIPANSTDDDGNGLVDDVNGWDFVDDDNTPDDFLGHGTGVAGTAASVTDNNLGTAGTAPDAELLPVRAGNDNGLVASSAAAEAIVYATDEGATVINASFSGTGFSQIQLDAIEYARLHDVLLVASAGNNGQDVDLGPRYPCAYAKSNILCVASIDSNGDLSSFSNYGATTVDLAAPGRNVLLPSPDFHTLLSENFETPIAGRWETGGTNNTWAQTAVIAGSPTQSVEDSPGANYLANTNSFIRMTNTVGVPVDLSAEHGCRARFFVHAALNDAGDALAVGAMGSSLQATFSSGGSVNGPKNSTFVQDSGLQLADGGAGVRLIFDLVTSATGNADGVYVDDVALVCRSASYDASNYGFANGTSFSSPYVAGVAALVRAAVPSASAVDTATAIRNAAVPLDSLDGLTISGGRADARAAIAAALNPPQPPQPPATSPPTGSTPGADIDQQAIADSLLRDLRRAVRALRKKGVDGLARAGGLTLKDVHALAAGEASLTVAATGPNRKAAATTLLASDARQAQGAGSLRLRARLMSRARKLVRSAQRMRLVVGLSFTERSGRRTAKSARTTIKRRTRRR